MLLELFLLSLKLHSDIVKVIKSPLMYSISINYGIYGFRNQSIMHVYNANYRWAMILLQYCYKL